MPADLAGWLGGRWTVRRDINHGEGSFEGTAEFRPDGGGLTWKERGQLRLGDFAGPAFRTLRLQPAAPGGEVWQVSFDDGRPFHELDLSTGEAEPEHLCGPDVYRGRFEIVGEDRFEVTWRVRGPRKDDTIRSTYVRAD